MLYYEDHGAGKVIVLLPGLLASARYWKNIANHLSKTNRVIVIDQLGFGKSPKPDSKTDYSIDANIRSYDELFQYLNIKQIDVLVGYSSSTILAIAYAAKDSIKINNLLLITPPIHFTKENAIEALKRSFRTYRYLMFGPLKSFFIAFVTIFRPFIRFISPLFLTHVEKDSARDAFSFTWKSLYKTIENVIANQSVLVDLEKIQKKNIHIKILYAMEDNIVREENLFVIRNKFSNIKLRKILSTHQIPLQRPKLVMRAIQTLLND